MHTRNSTVLSPYPPSPAPDEQFWKVEVITSLYKRDHGDTKTGSSNKVPAIPAVPSTYSRESARPNIRDKMDRSCSKELQNRPNHTTNPARRRSNCRSHKYLPGLQTLNFMSCILLHRTIYRCYVRSFDPMLAVIQYNTWCQWAVNFN